MSGSKRIKVNRQQVIALTGGIGSGKSFAMKCFAKLGFTTFNTDMAIHRLLQENHEVYQQIKSQFPGCIDNNGINRNLLGQIIFANPQNLKQLESILHPVILEERNRYIEKTLKRRKGPIVIEIPLLFEKGATYNYDFIISTITTIDIQKARAFKRKGMTEKKFNAIIALQTTNEYRIKNSTGIINTSYNVTNTFRQIKKLIGHARFKGNSTGY